MTSLPSLFRILSFNLYRASEALEVTFAFDLHVIVLAPDPLRQIRESLPDEVVKTVAYSVIGSRLYYRNALLSRMSKSNFTKLQRVQNTLVCVVLGLRKFKHITPALKELHWLPGQYRVTVKTAVLVYSIEKTAVNPPIPSQLMQDYEPIRSLRSLIKNLICRSAVGTVLASRGLHICTTYLTLFVKLQLLKFCKRKLKTHLCELAFGTWRRRQSFMPTHGT